ncbi:MAG: AarF/ABC1/UbiB kinase family protein [Acidobacteriota bacterium]
MARRIPSIPQIYRNVNRWREILGVVGKFGIGEGLARLGPGIARDLVPLGREVAHLSHETRVRLAFEELGPTAIKLGQVLSTRSDVVGARLAKELEKLQNHTPPTPFDAVRDTVEQALGQPLEQLFARFDPEPIASASIGQVHGARLLPSADPIEDPEAFAAGPPPPGDEVVVKVQHPGIRRIVRVDLEILAGLAQLAERLPEYRAYRPVETVAELQRTLLRELDFTTEERHLSEFRSLFEDDGSVRIPRPYTDLSSERVLTMERLHGVTISETAALRERGHDLDRIARRGARIYMDMVFRYGVYHADPHPGNVLVLEGDVVGLIDFGMVGRLDAQLREDVEDILLSLLTGDANHLMALIIRVGQAPQDLDRPALDVDLAEFVAHYTRQEAGDFDLAGALTDMVNIVRRHRIQLPARFSMLVKMLIVLEGSARLLAPRFSLLEVISGYEKRLVLRRLAPRRRVLKLIRLYGEVENLLEVMPRHMIEILEQLQSGKFDVHLDHRGLEPSVNRLVWGLVTSALFLGSSLLMAFRVPPSLYGFSVLGLAGYLLSTVLGLRLLRAINKSGHLDRGKR